jgi:hypothetical protein
MYKYAFVLLRDICKQQCLLISNRDLESDSSGDADDDDGSNGIISI